MQSNLVIFLTSVCLVFGICRAASAECDLQSSSCISNHTHSITAELNIEPKPIRSMKALDIFVKLQKAKKPMRNAKVIVNFVMPSMYMGVNRAELKHTADGKYQGRWVLPRCPQGTKTWRAELSIEIPQTEPLKANYLFDVVK